MPACRAAPCAARWWGLVSFYSRAECPVPGRAGSADALDGGRVPLPLQARSNESYAPLLSRGDIAGGMAYLGREQRLQRFAAKLIRGAAHDAHGARMAPARAAAGESQLSLPSTCRFHLLTGEAVTMVFLGGSITAGGCLKEGQLGYPAIFANWASPCLMRSVARLMKLVN